MKIRSKMMGPLVLIFFIVGIGGTMIANYWNSEKIKIPVKFKEGEFKGEYDPADIRGSYSFEDVNKTFKVPISDIAKAFGFGDAETQSQLKAKDIERVFGELDQGELGTDQEPSHCIYIDGKNFLYSRANDGITLKKYRMVAH